MQKSAISTHLGWGIAALILLASVVTWVFVGGLVLSDSLRATPTLLPTIAILNSTPIVTQPAATDTLVPQATSTSTSAPTLTPSVTSTVTPTTALTAPATVDIAGTQPATLRAIAPPGCAIPSGWVPHQVVSGETLFGYQLGAGGKIDVNAIMVGNCLKSKLLTLGQTVYLPPGAAENAPKVDQISGGASLPQPTGLTRKPNCPCTITVHDGWRLEQIAAAVDRAPVGFTGRDFLAVTATGAPVPALGFLSSKPGDKSLEGFMLPGTYTLQNDTSAMAFRDVLLNAFGTAITPKIQADAATHGYTFWQVMVIASMVQRESWAEHEQKLIASVFYNRFKAGKAAGTTTTLQYALGRAGNWWPKVHGSMVNINSRYNMYIYGGLPPSVIANPGLTAILSAVYPAQTEYQYFNAKCGGGGNFYAKTWEEFEQGLKCP
jgi:hypothetical protein